MRTDAFLAIVIGNTTLRWRLVNAGAIQPGGDAPAAGGAPAALRAAAAHRTAVIASVNPPVMLRVCEALGPTARIAGVDVAIPIANATRRPEQVGVDRLLAALGAWHARGASIVIDAGTALTIDLVTEGPTFQGGAILPGRELSAQALRAGTALLPEVRFDTAPAARLGRDTEEAIACGIFWGQIGALRLLAARMRAEAPHAGLCITGGAAPLLAPHLGEAAHHDPDLVFRGIAACLAAAGG